MERLKVLLSKRLYPEELQTLTEQELQNLLDNGWHTEVALCAVTREQLEKPNCGTALRMGSAILIKLAFKEGTAKAPYYPDPEYHITWDEIKQEFMSQVGAVLSRYSPWRPSQSIFPKTKAT